MKILEIPNQIIRKKLTPLNINKVDGIAFHHMANKTWSVKDVEHCHVYSNGWIAIGYNYWIDFEGNIYEGRGLNVGAGVENHNSHVISIGLQGDFTTQSPTEAQYKSCYELTEYLKTNLPNIKHIGKHSDYNTTACPGKNFDINKILNYTEEKEMEEKIYNWVTACPEWSQSYVHKALELGIIKGDEKGNLNLTDTKIWCLVVTMRATGIMK